MGNSFIIFKNSQLGNKCLYINDIVLQDINQHNQVYKKST